MSIEVPKFDSLEEENEYKLEIAREKARSYIKKQKAEADKKSKANTKLITDILVYGGGLLLLYFFARQFGF